MDLTELHTNLLVADGGELLKVSTVHSPERVTAQVVYPVPARTTVRSYGRQQVATWTTPSDELVAKYDKAYARA